MSFGEQHAAADAVGVRFSMSVPDGGSMRCELLNGPFPTGALLGAEIRGENDGRIASQSFD